MRRALFRTPAAALGLGVAWLLAEITLRLVPERPRYESWFEDAARAPIRYEEALARGLVVSGLPRGRSTWAPGIDFYICYRGGARPYMDARGCVPVHINEHGIRDRRGLPLTAPADQPRILCIGDSFTFGWGVPAELTWVRLLESELAAHGNVRTINCGAAGALYVDEYLWALRDRFAELEHDAVLVTLCLNDLVLMPNTVGLFRPDLPPPEPPASRLWWILSGRAAAEHERYLEARVRLDPAVDWGRLLIDNADAQMFAARGEDPAWFWKAGAPQQALREIRDLCRRRGVAFGVVLWPLLQGLAPGAYPFATLHAEVAGLCAAEGIPLLDLLPTFVGQDPATLWVDPSDMHANEIAHALAAPPIARFVETLGFLPPR